MAQPRVLLIGYYGKANFGDDVLLHVAHGIIKRTLPDAEISVIVGDHGGEYVHDLLKGAIVQRPGRHGYFDLIVHGGGGVFFDFSTHGFKHRLLERVAECFGMRRVVALEKFIRRVTGKPRTSAHRRLGFGIGVGTFAPGSPKLWRHSLHILADFDALWVRDTQSLKNLKRFARAMKAEQIHGSDLAFLTEYWMAIPPALKEKSARPRLGIALRDLGSADARMLEKLLARLAEKYDITGFIFDEKDDPKMQAVLTPYTTVIWRPHTMSIHDFAGFLSRQDVLLTSRAHGAICGACLGVPSVIVNIEPKLEQVHRMLPSASLLVAADKTELWETAVEKALIIPREAVASDVAGNRDASEAAVLTMQRWML